MTAHQTIEPPLAAPRPVELTVRDYEPLIELGFFALKTGKIELGDGVLVRLNSTDNPHHRMQRWLFRKIDRLLEARGDELIVGQEPSLRIVARTSRDPDMCVYRDRGPLKGLMPAEDVALVIEVSDTTLAYDLGRKALDYARANIPACWVVDLTGRVTHVHHQPTPDGHARRDVAAFGQPFESLALGSFAVEG